MDDVETRSRELNLAKIIEAARQQTGLREIGEPDIGDGLRVLVDSLNREANLRPDGVESQRASLTGLVANRLRINDVFTRHPEISEEELRGPIVIVGLPRTGTTKLHRMLAANPDLQSLPLYKLLFPAPLAPTPPGGEDPRIAVAEMVSAGMLENFPDFFAGHPMLPREADEEVWMLDLVTRGWMPCYTATVPSFAAWTERQAFGTWYGYLRRLLQMFQWQDGSPSKMWLLKAPEHMGHLDLLFDTFPDATVVQTHRDPVTAIASIAVLTVASRRMYTDRPDPAEAGQFTLKHWSESLRRLVERRPELERRHRFVDVPYWEITGDPMGAIERIAAVAGLDLTAHTRATMRAWEANNPQHKHGQHRYELDQVGLEEPEVRAAFAEYVERFGHLF
jgi:Sulfotransferase family